MSFDILSSNDINQLRKFAKQVGVKLHTNDNLDRIKAKIAEKLGEFGYVNTEAGETNASDDAQERARSAGVGLIMSGAADTGLSPYPTNIPKGRLPNLLPFKKPWGGRRMRVKRLVGSQDAQRILFVHWNGYPFVIGLEAEYADLPWPHYNVLNDAVSERLKQKKVLDDEGRAMYENIWYPVKSFPIERIGVTPKTEHLPRSFKEYFFSAYAEGFPDWTLMMWKQAAQAYGYDDKSLGIKPSTPQAEQLAARRSTLLDRLNLADLGDAKGKREERLAVVSELLSDNPLAEAA